MVRYWLLRLFFLFRTVGIVGYVLMMTLLSQDLIKNVHAKLPPLQYVSSFLSLQEYPEWELRSEDSQERVETTLKLFRRSAADEEQMVRFDEEEKTTDLFTPSYTFVWEVWTWLVSFIAQHENKNTDWSVSQNLLESVNEDGVRTRDVSLANSLLNQWKNTYTFEAINSEGKKKTYTKILDVEYEEILLWNTTLYLDPYFKQEDTKIVRNEDDFDGITTSFLTVGCIDTQQEVLIQYEWAYSFVPACLTYSKKKSYLVYFGNRRETSGEYIYTAQSPEHGLVYNNFPLYQRRWWSLYQSLLFFNPWGNFVQVVKATGDIHNYETLIQHYDIRSQRNTMSLRQINGEQIEIENGYEKTILYYYKNNESRRNVVFPGLRYKYYVIRSWRWKLIDQWTVYHLDEKVRIPPSSETWSVFRLDAWLHGDEVVVEDPFMHVTYDITSLRNEVSTFQKPKDKFSCDNASVGIYGTSAEAREFVYEHDDINLLWAGRDVYEVRLEDNHGSQYEVEQQVFGYIASRIEPRERGVASGETIFTLKGYNEDGREICKKRVPITILSK